VLSTNLDRLTNIEYLYLRSNYLLSIIIAEEQQ